MAASPRRRHSLYSACVTSLPSGSLVRRSLTSSMPRRRPRPRTSPTHRYFSLSSSSRLSITAPTRSAFLTRFSLRMIWSAASPAAEARGLPPYDDELAEGLDQGLRLVNSSVETTAESGKPPPMPLPTVMMSGTTPSCSAPHMGPVRPKPVIISWGVGGARASLGAWWGGGGGGGGGVGL